MRDCRMVLVLPYVSPYRNAVPSFFGLHAMEKAGRSCLRPGFYAQSCRRGTAGNPGGVHRAAYLMYWFSHLSMVPSALMPAIHSFTAVRRLGHSLLMSTPK